ncbi:glycosyl transferase family 2 [Haloferax sp. Atlit-10N]|uniref:glycosyl transferase family 2 n=1 Tax=unclassified Haloferax TaxID=2625095 RepID=UPI000E22643C|nr:MULTISPECIES: glycosyl transferase family 2 [unclassified Haloferax]RDZ46520.1 glycosyl transferase family 2 [Haloferax sp. Atlit-16N]RDZ60353.1 glycosyl transferase family 2 [Haloferax sp. Atlit-10N]
MEYVQERVTTLHDLSGAVPDAPTDRAAVVVPMTEREYAGLAAERVLSTLESLSPARVVVPLRAPADRVAPFADWLDEYDLPLDVLWCDGPRVADLLDSHGLDGERGKGRDVWLALGCAAREEYVVVHDADTKTYDERYVPRLLFPLAHGHDFSKGYYARVEEGQLYGRLFRLFYAPLVRALEDETNAPIVRYLDSFRYALAGEFAATSDLALRMRSPRKWGLEVGTLGDAFAHAGFDRSAQVDLGEYEHDHRSVSGPTGLSDMSESVGRTLLRAVVEHGGTVEFDTLAERYREAGNRLVEQYAADAAFNGFDYDRTDEREQVATYAEAISKPGEDTRLPAWRDTSLSPDEVLAAASDDLDDVREAAGR